VVGSVSRVILPLMILCILIFHGIGTTFTANANNTEPSRPKAYPENPAPHGKTVRVGVSHNPPFALHGNGGPPTGFVIDIINKVARRQGWTLVYVEKKWPELLASLDAGTIDLLGGIAYTPAWALKYDLSNEPVANNWAVVYRAKGTTINGIADLNGKRIALLPKGVHTVALKKLAKSFEFNFIEIPAKGYANTLELLDRGQADAGVIARTFHILHGSDYQALATNIRFNPIEIRFAAPKGAGKEVLSAIDEYLSRQKNDPASEYRQLLDKWFKSPTAEFIPAWVVDIMIGFSALLILSISFVFLLRRQVAKKTKEAQDAMRKYRSIFENAAEGIFQSTPEGRFINANPAMARILNYASPDDLMRTVTDIGNQLFCDPDARANCVNLLQSAGHFTDKEIQWKRKDGTIVWVSESVQALKDDNGTTYFEGTIQDITDRKQVEDALNESETQLRTIFESSAAGIGRSRLTDGKILRANQKLAQIFGYDDLDAYINEFIFSERFVTKTDRNQLIEDYRANKNVTVEVDYYAHDGSIVTALSNGTVNLEAGYIDFVLIDISERKHLEDQLRQSQRMEAVGQLTGGIAHDFNNLMGVMIGNVELLEDKVGGDENVAKNIQAIIAAVERGSSLTSRLLAFSRRQTLAPVAVNVRELIDHLEDMLRRTLGETIALNVHHSTDLWLGLLDPHQFDNALLNLAINARDAMPQGGTLVIETTNITLTDIDVAQAEEVLPGDYIRVSVRDSGTGMHPDVLGKVFEPFFTTKDIGDGSGLGLSMVYGFIRQSNGHVSINSAIDLGTTVMLFLPRFQDDAIGDGARQPSLAAGPVPRVNNPPPP